MNYPTQDDWMKKIYADQQAAVARMQANAYTNVVTPHIPRDMLFGSQYGSQLLLGRLHMSEVALAEKRSCIVGIMPAEDDRVAVVFHADNKTMILHDERGLFPSDGLVTQLRLILETR